ncbi:MAG: SLOG family protein [Eubacteriales bacterium]
MRACAFIGHRNVPNQKYIYIKHQLKCVIRYLIEQGYTHFISEFSDGVGLIAAATVAEFKESNPYIRLEAMIPYRSRLKNEDYEVQRLLGKCDIIGISSDENCPESFEKHSRFMVQRSQLLVAVYDGRKLGSTIYTMQYADTVGVEVKVVWI